MNCPRDNEPLREVLRRKTRVDVCGRCGGAWFDRNEFEVLLATGGRTRVGVGEIKKRLLGIQLQRELYDHEIPDDPRFPCPRCKAAMKKIQFRSRDAIVVGDQCTSCEGYWFDAGEHGSVYAFLERQARRSGRRVLVGLLVLGVVLTVAYLQSR